MSLYYVLSSLIVSVLRDSKDNCDSILDIICPGRCPCALSMIHLTFIAVQFDTQARARFTSTGYDDNSVHFCCHAPCDPRLPHAIHASDSSFTLLNSPPDSSNRSCIALPDTYYKKYTHLSPFSCVCQPSQDDSLCALYIFLTALGDRRVSSRQAVVCCT